MPGLASLLIVLLALGFGTARVRRRVLPDWEGAAARLAELILAVSTLIVILTLLGAAGLLAVGWVVALSVSVGAAAAFAARPPATAAPSPTPRAPRPEGRRWATAIALGASAWVLADWFARSLPSIEHGIYGGDSLWYHMPFAARFAESGSITALHFTGFDYLSWFYPANSELLHAGGISLLGSDQLSPILNVVWLGIALLAAWCIGRPFGVAPISLLTVSLVLGSTSLADTQPGTANTDILALAMLLAAAALIVNGLRPDADSARSLRSIAPAAATLAAAAAGVGIGTKLIVVIPLVTLAIGIVALAAKPDRRRIAALVVVALLLTGGSWYVRNLLDAGNPLPWVEIGFGPLSLPSPETPLNGWAASVASYATDFDVWTGYLIPGLADRLGPLWWLVVIGAAAGSALAMISGPTRAQRLLGAVAAIAAIAYVVTPLTAEGPPGEPVNFDGNLRQVAPALALGIALLPTVGALVGRVRCRQTLLAAALALALAVTNVPLAVPVADPVAILIAAAGIALTAATIRLGSEVLGRGAGSTAWIAVALLAAGALWLDAGSYEARRYQEGASKRIRQTGLDGAYRWAQQQTGVRIGTTSVLQYGLFGPELDNSVDLIGEAQADGSFTPYRSCRRWREAVNGGGYDYLVVAPLYTGAEPPPAAEWARSPATSEALRDRAVSVVRVNGPLDPLRCGGDRAQSNAR